MKAETRWRVMVAWRRYGVEWRYEMATVVVKKHVIEWLLVMVKTDVIRFFWILKMNVVAEAVEFVAVLVLLLMVQLVVLVVLLMVP